MLCLDNNTMRTLPEKPGVVSVFPNMKRRLHTTHSWDFMGLLGEETMEIPGHSTTNQVNVIVGFIDTGEAFVLLSAFSLFIWVASLYIQPTCLSLF